MSTPGEIDQKIAKKLDLPAHEVYSFRRQIKGSTAARVLAAEIELQVEGNRSSLEGCSPDDLRRIQGIISGLRAATFVLTEKV